MKKNYYKTLSIIIFSIQTLIYIFIFFTGDIEREGEREREGGGREGKRGGSRESKILKEKQS